MRKAEKEEESEKSPLLRRPQPTTALRRPLPRPRPLPHPPPPPPCGPKRGTELPLRLRLLQPTAKVTTISPSSPPRPGTLAAGWSAPATAASSRLCRTTATTILPLPLRSSQTDTTTRRTLISSSTRCTTTRSIQSDRRGRGRGWTFIKRGRSFGGRRARTTTCSRTRFSSQEEEEASCTSSALGTWTVRRRKWRHSTGTYV